MQKFDYRAPRFTVDFPVRLKLQESLHFARCRDISEDGMRLELREPFPPESCGEVFFSYQDVSLELHVRVAHTGATWGGLTFIYQSENERKEMLDLLSRLAIQRRTTGLFVVD